MKSIFTFFLLTSVLFSAFGTSPGLPSKKNKSTGDIQDEVNIRCLYKYSQKAIDRSDTIMVADTMMLEIGNAYSLYYNWNQAFQDSLFKNNIPKVESIISISVLKGSDDFSNIRNKNTGKVVEPADKRETVKIYKNRNTKECIAIDSEASMGDNVYFKCAETIDFTWEYREDTLTVMGYLCQNATTTFRGRTFSVWFTMEIPVNEGPWKLYGLPGLILQASDSNNLFEFQAIGIERAPENSTISMSEEEYIKCDYKQFRKMRDKKLSQKMVWHIEGGTVNIASIDNPLTYLHLELD